MSHTTMLCMDEVENTDYAARAHQYLRDRAELQAALQEVRTPLVDKKADEKRREVEYCIMRMMRDL